MSRFLRYIPVLFVGLLVTGLHIGLSVSDATYYMTQNYDVGLLLAGRYWSLCADGIWRPGVSGTCRFFRDRRIHLCRADDLQSTFVPRYSADNLFSFFGIDHRTPDLYDAQILSFSPWLAFLVSLLMAGLIAFLIGLPVIRLKGHYLAMATLGFGLIIYRLVLGAEVFGQADGISNVPPMKILGSWEVNGGLPFASRTTTSPGLQ